MQESKIVLGIVGSPNPEGRTNKLVLAALKGATEAGVTTELIQLSEYAVAACKDCLPWVCADNLKCTYEDEAFEYVSQKILNSGALILGTPVYWWDTSALIKYLILKMFRVYARTAPLQGLPALGLAIAGGTGNGLISGLRPVYHFFQMLQMRALEPVPATRFNLNEALTRATELGGQIAGMTKKRAPFKGLEERLVWYDNLPYLGDLISPGSVAYRLISLPWRQPRRWARMCFQALHDLTPLVLPGEAQIHCQRPPRYMKLE